MKIMLACCLGMSTSVVVQKMKDAAKEQGKDYEIWAVDQNKIAENVGNFDVLLLGPQVRHLQRKVKATVGDSAPVADRKSTRLNSSHIEESRMPSSA